MISDLELVYLWRQYSEEYYSASWILVGPGTLEHFMDWLDGCGTSGEKRTLEDFECKDLPAIREAHQSRRGEVAEVSGSPRLD